MFGSVKEIPINKDVLNIKSCNCLAIFHEYGFDHVIDNAEEVYKKQKIADKARKAIKKEEERRKKAEKKKEKKAAKKEKESKEEKK